MRNFVRYSVRQFFAIILSLLLCISFLPISVFADDGLQMNTPGGFASENPSGLELTADGALKETPEENTSEAGKIENTSGGGIALNPENSEVAGMADDQVLIVDDKEMGDGLYQFNYSSGWNYSGTNQAFNGSNHYTSQNGAYVTLPSIDNVQHASRQLFCHFSLLSSLPCIGKAASIRLENCQNI